MSAVVAQIEENIIADAIPNSTATKRKFTTQTTRDGHHSGVVRSRTPVREEEVMESIESLIPRESNNKVMPPPSKKVKVKQPARKRRQQRLRPAGYKPPVRPVEVSSEEEKVIEEDELVPIVNRNLSDECDCSWNP